LDFRLGIASHLAFSRHPPAMGKRLSETGNKNLEMNA
jgi:hypothetical protein